MLAEGSKMAPWWAKDRIVGVRFRGYANGRSTNDGSLTVFYRYPWKWLGPYCERSRPFSWDEYHDMMEHSR